MRKRKALSPADSTGPIGETLTVRDYLTPGEMREFLQDCRYRGRNRERDYCAVLLAYRHGLRVSELCSLEWSQLDLKSATIHVRRSKGSHDSVHPLRGDELRALRALPRSGAPWVFTTERGGPMTRHGFWQLLARRAKQAKLPIKVHPHTLRHSCGYALANAGHDLRLIQHYLGHANVQNTVRYTKLNAGAFRDVFRD